MPTSTDLDSTLLSEIEAEIDTAFAKNALVDRPYSQAIWTVLSVVEDMHFKHSVISPLGDIEMNMFVDGLLNALTYPARIIHAKSERSADAVVKEYIDADYGAAVEWINNAEDYLYYCSIFPLFHAKQITVRIVNDELICEYISKSDTRYEAYDRLMGKRDDNEVVSSNPNALVSSIMKNLVRRGEQYDVILDKRLMAATIRVFSDQYASRFVLPAQWDFLEFSLAQFKSVLVRLQSIASMWMVARQIFVSNGVRGVGYSSSVWTPAKKELIKLLEKHTQVPLTVIQSILSYLTFGEKGIRQPDVATQPIFDLGNGCYAISSFLMMHTNAERNLCVLLNQIVAERKNYSRLVDQKEAELYAVISSQLSPIGYDISKAKLDTTDVDISIIDRKAKICLCLELKWFIEPAEIREVNARSEELRKGVAQCIKLNELFATQDRQLLASLNIDPSYKFLAVVGSANFIGRSDIQSQIVPILKVWHLIKHIRDNSLACTIKWLSEKDYLPKEEINYKVVEVPLKIGKWRARWYGFKEA
jgi:hypothetical protein